MQRRNFNQAATSAPGLLTDGFPGSPKVRIALSGQLEDAAKLLNNLSQEKRLGKLTTAIHRAAEIAILMGQDARVSAVRSMNVNHAKNIWTGGCISVTAFFADKTRSPLAARFCRRCLAR